MPDKGATTFWEDFDIGWVKGTGRIDEFPPKGEEDIHGDRGDYCYKRVFVIVCATAGRRAWSVS